MNVFKAYIFIIFYTNVNLHKFYCFIENNNKNM